MRKLMSIFCVWGLVSTSFALGTTPQSAQGYIALIDGNAAVTIERISGEIEQGYAEVAELIVQLDGMEEMEGEETDLIIEALFDKLAPFTKGFERGVVFDENEEQQNLFNQIETKLQEIGVQEERMASLVLTRANTIEMETEVPIDDASVRRELQEEIESMERSLTTGRAVMWTSLPVGIVSILFIGSSLLGDSVRGAVISTVTAVGGISGFIYGLVRTRKAKRKLKELREELEERAEIQIDGIGSIPGNSSPEEPSNIFGGGGVVE